MSKIIWCGDYRQTDLNKKKNDMSGILKFFDIAMHMAAFTRIEFTADDIVRSSLVKDYILSASNIAYTLGRYLNTHVQMEVASKNSSRSSDTTVCGSNYASFDMTLCLMRVRARQLEAFAEVDRLKSIKATALTDKNLSLSKFTSAREKIFKAGYDVDLQNSNAMSQLGKNI
jgi:hypothetical protein